MSRKTFQNFPLDDLTGGLNLRDYPSEIDDKQSLECTNFDFKGNKLISAPGVEQLYNIGGGAVQGMTTDGENLYHIAPATTSVNKYIVTFSAIDGKVFSIEIDGVKKVYQLGFYNNETTALSNLLTTLQTDFPTYTITRLNSAFTINKGTDNISIVDPELVKNIEITSWDADAKIGITIDGNTYTTDGATDPSTSDVYDYIIASLTPATYYTEKSGGKLYIGRIDNTATTISVVQYDRYTYDIQYKHADTLYTGQYHEYTDLTIDGITNRYIGSSGRPYNGDRQINQFKDINLGVESIDIGGSTPQFTSGYAGYRIYVKKNCKLTTVGTKDAYDGSVRLSTDGGVPLMTVGLPGNGTGTYPYNATFNYDLVAGTYYRIEIDNNTSSFIKSNTTSYTGTNIDLISGSGDGPRWMIINTDSFDDSTETIRSTLYRKSGGGTDSSFVEGNRAQYFNQYHSLFIRKTDYSTMSISSINKYTDSGSFPNDTLHTSIYTTNHKAGATISVGDTVIYTTQNDRQFNLTNIYKNGAKVSPDVVYFCYVYTVSNSESYKIRINGATEFTYTSDGSATEDEIATGLAAQVNLSADYSAVIGSRDVSGLSNRTTGAASSGVKSGFYVYRKDLTSFTLEADTDYIGGENDMAKGLVPNNLIPNDIYNLTITGDGLLVVSSLGFAPQFYDTYWIQRELPTSIVGTPRNGTQYLGKVILGGYTDDKIVFSKTDDLASTTLELVEFSGYNAGVQRVGQGDTGRVTGFYVGEDGLYVFKNNSIYKTNSEKDTGSKFSFLFNKITDNGALNQFCIVGGGQDIFYYDGINRAIRRLSYEQNLSTLRDTAISSEIEDILLSLPEDDEGNDERFTNLYNLQYSYPYLEFNYADETSPYIYLNGLDLNQRYRLPDKTLVYNVYSKAWRKKTDKKEGVTCSVANYYGDSTGNIFYSNKGNTIEDGTFLSKEYTFGDDVDFKRIGELEVVGDITGIGGTKRLEIECIPDGVSTQIGEPTEPTKRIIEATDGVTKRFRERIDLYDDCEIFQFRLNHSGDGEVVISDVNIRYKPISVFHSDYF